MDERLLMIFVVAPFAASIIVGWFGWTQARADRLTTPALGWTLAAIMGGMFALGLAFMPGITAGETYTLSIEWMPQIGLTFLLYLDGLGLLFVLLVTGIGAGIMAYAGYYLDPGRQPPNFLGLMLAFSGAMLGLVLSGNVITLFIAWELTSVTSYLLIGFKGKDPEARRGASMALFITASGGLALLVGLLMMGAAAGTNDLPAMLSSGELLREHPYYSAIAILIMIGCFTKSAQFPFHFWLPNAMTAPTPASAFLHSATMVKAGVYLLARFYPALGDTPLWETGLVGIGLVTMALGALLAIRQRDLKGSLAYATISQLGALVALIGLPHGEGLKAAFVGILAHALYKAALFLVVGAVDHATGTRDLGKLGGLRRVMPGFAIATGIAAVSMVGVPPLLNFVAKEYMFDAYYHIENFAALAVVWASAALGGTMALIIFWEVFIGGAVKPEAWTADSHHDDHGGHDDHGEKNGHGFHAPHPLLVLAPGALAALSILLGLGAGLLSPLASAAVGKSVSIYLIPPEITLVFWLSMAAIATAVGVFLIRKPVRRLMNFPLPSGPAAFRALIGSAETAGEDRSNSLLERAADALLTTQGGKIRYYLVVIFLGVLTVLVLPPSVLFGIDLRLPSQAIDLSGTGLLKLTLLGLALAATLASILFPQHLVAALLLGVAGYAIGGIFLLEPAPDVALVQFLVETLATVLLVIILARTSAHERREVIALARKQGRAGMARDIVVSVLIGGAVTVFALAATGSRPTPNPISVWHLENTYREVGATDVVAAIVTDFRGMDTLVEITVFALASLGVLTMITRPGRSKFAPVIRRQDADLTQELEAMREGPSAFEDAESAPMYRSAFSNPVTRISAALVTPIALLIAVGHILYGGVAPGDGFTAGVIGGLAVALTYIIFGYDETRRRLIWLRPAPLIGVGLLVSLVNAALPLLAERAFMAHTTLAGIDIAGIKFASSTLFEFGIFLTVFAGVSTIMEAIAHPTEVETL